MQVISSELGFVLFFNNADDLEGRIEHLQGFLEYIKSENTKPPHLYGIFDDRIPEEEARDVLETIKLKWSPLSENEDIKAMQFELEKIKNLARALLNDIYEFGEPPGGKAIEALHDLVFED